MRTYGKHCGSIVVDNKNNENNNIEAIGTTLTFNSCLNYLKINGFTAN